MNRKNGSITVEATLIFPIFLAVMSLFLFFFQVLFIQTRMESAIDNVGRKCAVYWHGVELLKKEIIDQQDKETISSKVGTELLQDGMTVLYVKNEVLKQYGENAQWIKNGKKGISFLGSGIDESGTVLKIVVTYEIEIPFVPNASFRCIQSCWKRLWTGEAYEAIIEESEAEENYVFVTKNGQVYHATMQCSHLKRTIRMVNAENLSNEKNKEGKHYDACELCCKEDRDNEVYYVTTTGTHYHDTITCSSLTRYVEKRLFSEIGNLKGCTRCVQT